jgi:hypothetical protein
LHDLRIIQSVGANCTFYAPDRSPKGGFLFTLAEAVKIEVNGLYARQVGKVIEFLSSWREQKRAMNAMFSGKVSKLKDNIHSGHEKRGIAALQDIVGRKHKYAVGMTVNSFGE